MKSISIALVLAAATPAFAATFSTVPVGYTTVPVDAKSASIASTTTFGVPLDDVTPPSTGIRAGKIDSFTATTITSAAGGWTSTLATPAAPWALRIMSGAAAGKTLDLTANTPNTLTVAGADLTTLGIVAGTDTFELVPVDTLATLFGSSTLLGGTSASLADNVQVRTAGTWLAYYFDTNLGFWRRTIGPATNSNNVLLRPGVALQVIHRGPALNLTFTGRVLPVAFRVPITNAGSTGTHTGFPTDTTLGAFAVQTLLPNWHSGLDTSNADQLGIFNGSVSTNYFYNGTHWRPSAGDLSSPDADTVAIPAGAVILVQRIGTASGTADLVRTPPFAL